MSSYPRATMLHRSLVKELIDPRTLTKEDIITNEANNTIYQAVKRIEDLYWGFEDSFFNLFRINESRELYFTYTDIDKSKKIRIIKHQLDNIEACLPMTTEDWLIKNEKSSTIQIVKQKPSNPDIPFYSWARLFFAGQIKIGEEVSIYKPMPTSSRGFWGEYKGLYDYHRIPEYANITFTGELNNIADTNPPWRFERHSIVK